MDWDVISDKLQTFGDKVGKGLKGFFGSRNQREVGRLEPTVKRIAELEPWAQGLSADEFKAKTTAWREALAAEETDLDTILPEAFALVREAAVRTLGMRHFDVQMVGGIVLHKGAVAEMATGEGKTLVATLPLYLNSLSNKSCYLVTVNDYLARRDAEWMTPIFHYLGVTIGAIQSSMQPWERHPIYACDIVYGTNNEFGFDYLRDNMKQRVEDQVQRHLHYAIIDEVDSILIDEARTPLIISGPAEQSSDKYKMADRVARALKIEEHFEVKEKERSASLLEEGIEAAQKMIGVDSFYTPGNEEWPHFIENSLRAHHVYAVDREYVVEEGEVVIVDEFTGRKMSGRRWSDGLHQAVETKEGLEPKKENQTLATITFQNYFRLYNKLAGMTGTALTEANEFHRVYGLDTVSIPTNLPIAREDENDVVFRTETEKWKALVEEIGEVHTSGQPLLVGTGSVEKSEHLSKLLKQAKIPHDVLNAKNHEREASIVAMAGEKGAVTVATNMAGRGTDIKLGGNFEYRLSQALEERGLVLGDEEHLEEIDKVRDELRAQCEKDETEVLGFGGLYVLCAERHEARRIDNQLRGRSGRQGNVGRSRFVLSLEDDLMRRFYRDWVKNAMGRLGMAEGVPIESRMVTRAIERAQRKVEDYNFEIRKNLLEYDEVMDQQRKSVYGVRQDALESKGLRETIEKMIQAAVDRHAGIYEKDAEGFQNWFQRTFGVELDAEKADLATREEEPDVEPTLKRVLEYYSEREEEVGSELMRNVERYVLLNTLDGRWKDHLRAIDALKTGIGLRGYAQVDPKNEYKREGFELFQKLLQVVEDEVSSLILRIEVKRREEGSELPERRPASEANVQYGGPQKTAAAPTPQQVRRAVARRMASQRVPAAAAFDLERRKKLVTESKQRAAAASETADPAAGSTSSSATGGAEATASPAAEAPSKAAGSTGAPAREATPATAPKDLPPPPKGPQLTPQQQAAALKKLKEGYEAAGRNDPCPCGSGKKFKKCHG